MGSLPSLLGDSHRSRSLLHLFHEHIFPKQHDASCTVKECLWGDLLVTIYGLLVTKCQGVMELQDLKILRPPGSCTQHFLSMNPTKHSGKHGQHWQWRLCPHQPAGTAIPVHPVTFHKMFFQNLTTTHCREYFPRLSQQHRKSRRENFLEHTVILFNINAATEHTSQSPSLSLPGTRVEASKLWLRLLLVLNKPRHQYYSAEAAQSIFLSQLSFNYFWMIMVTE